MVGSAETTHPAVMATEAMAMAMVTPGREAAPQHQRIMYERWIIQSCEAITIHVFLYRHDFLV